MNKNFEFSLIDHYKKLFFFNFKRFENNNYQMMREYFSHVLISEIEPFMSMNGIKILDVGGAEGDFCKVLHDVKGCDCINIDVNPGKPVWPKTIKGRADSLPFKDGEFDLVISRGVIEHIPWDGQQLSINEIHRVIKPGGASYIMLPPWFSPHGGHDLKPFHYLPFKSARRLKQWTSGIKIGGNSYADFHLYPTTFRRMEKMIKNSGVEIIATLDTHFRLHFLTKVPVLREIMVPSAVFISRKKNNGHTAADA